MPIWIDEKVNKIRSSWNIRWENNSHMVLKCFHISQSSSPWLLASLAPFASLTPPGIWSHGDSAWEKWSHFKTMWESYILRYVRRVCSMGGRMLSLPLALLLLSWCQSVVSDRTESLSILFIFMSSFNPSMYKICICTVYFWWFQCLHFMHSGSAIWTDQRFDFIVRPALYSGTTLAIYIYNLNVFYFKFYCK